MNYIIIILIVLACVFLVFHDKKKPSEETLEMQRKKYVEILSLNNVPENHYKIVVGQSKIYNMYNCPAIIWKEGNVIKTLYLRANQTPLLASQEEEDYLFLASQPYVDFLRFDGSEYPDWAVQPEYVKQLFMPYVNNSISKGGIDYDKNMYWVGTTCVYAASMAEVFKMLGRPLCDFENMVQNKKVMAKDGSIPEDMLEEYRQYKLSRKETNELLKEDEKKSSASVAEMERAIQSIRESERKLTEDTINSLYAQLLTDKRFDDLERATRDENFRKQLLEEYAAIQNQAN